MASALCVGHALQDLVFSVPHAPDRGAKSQSTDFVSAGGGAAATAAVAIARLGGDAAPAVRVGDDAIAGLIVAEPTGLSAPWRSLEARRPADAIAPIRLFLDDAEAPGSHYAEAISVDSVMDQIQNGTRRLLAG